MSNTIFKRFFEVRVLHGYYLDHWNKDSAGTPRLFQEYDGVNADPIIRAQERKAIQDYILENRYNILKDLSIEPTKATKDLISGLRMRWRATPLGLMVGIEVRKEGSGATAKFFPKKMPPPDSNWAFTLHSRNLQLANITNHAFRPTLPGRYYFTNLRAVEDNKVFPSLATAPTAFATGRTWEMGELAMVAGNLGSAKKTTVAQGDFLQVPNFQWAHTGDRMAFPKRFNYRFDPSLSVNTAEFNLLSSETGGTLVKNITKDFTQNLPAPAETTLDFQYLPLPANPTDAEKLHPKPLPNGWYFLKVKVNGADFEGRQVLLHSDLNVAGNGLFGVVDISMGQTATDFQLLNPDDSLRLIQIPGSNPARWEPPIFEIRLMSRQTYWRYEIDNKAGLPYTDINTFTDVEYKGAGQHVVSKVPRHMSLAPTNLSIDPPSGTTTLPAPDHSNLKYDQDQYFSELFLSTIKLT